HTTDFQVKVNYSNIQRTIQYGISNYNTYFFDSIDELIEKVGLSPQQETILPKQMRWEFVHKDNSDLNILLPSNPNPIFFRGQNKRYQPCYPTVSRNITTHSLTLQNLTPEEQISIIVNLVKSKWFGDLLEETPQFQWYKEQNIWIDKLALAQHYELPTGLIDLTQSIDVASFFACCKYENDSWAPMKSGEGVIYMLDWRLMPIENRKISAIGQQAFPRPSEQWGWTYEMNLNEDFDLLPFVKKYIFLHNEESSTKVLNKFSYGKDLFPDDPLFILADKIKKSKELPSQIMNSILDDLLNDEKGLKGCSKNEIVRSISKQFAILSEIRLLDESIKSKMQSLWDSQKDDFMNKIGGVGFSVVRTIKNRS
ncbi:MAG TPA: FRG domain-containing protein, partial [Bacteroidia bacterium]